MPLTKQQLSEIKDFIHSRGFTAIEVEMEILDHVVCAVEERMSESEMSFNDALVKVCSEMNPHKIQRQKLKYEYLRALKATLSEMCKPRIKKMVALLLSLLILAGFGVLEASPSTLLKLYMFLFVFSVMLFSASFSYKRSLSKPFSKTFVCSLIKVIISVSIILISLADVFLDDWFSTHATSLFIFIGLISWFAISGIKLLHNSFNKLKHAAH